MIIDFLLSDDYSSAFSLFLSSFMKNETINPRRKNAKQKPRPHSDWCFVLPLIIILMNNPNRNPQRLPVANSKPTAVPSPTGKTN